MVLYLYSNGFSLILLAVCSDIHPARCAQYERDGYCNSPNHIAWMHDNCKHSCDLCIHKGKFYIPILSILIEYILVMKSLFFLHLMFSII